MGFHPGRGLHLQEAEVGFCSPLQHINTNQRAAMFKGSFKDRRHVSVGDQFAGHSERVIEMLVIRVNQDATRKCFTRHIAHVLPLAHDGFGSLAGLGRELRLVNEEVEPFQALDSSDEPRL